MSEPLVTVIIPVKNGGARLRECLAAVGTQSTDFRFDVLCIDSGSTDDSLESVFEYLDGPIIRVTAPDTPVPFSAPLEDAFLPNLDKVLEKARWLYRY